MSTVRGEWWIDDRGDSHFADGDTGDVNHEMLAYCGALGLPLPGDTEDYDGPEFDVGQQLTPELISYLRDQGTPKDAIAFFSQPHQDAREFMLLYRNWIRVKGDNFEVGKFNADALRRIRNFEGWDDDDAEDSDGAVWIEERAGEPVWLANEGRWSDQGWYGKVPVRALLGEATVAELRAEYGARQNPRRRSRPARRNPRGMKPSVKTIACMACRAGRSGPRRTGKPMLRCAGCGIEACGHTLRPQPAPGEEGKVGWCFSCLKAREKEWREKHTRSNPASRLNISALISAPGRVLRIGKLQGVSRFGLDVEWRRETGKRLEEGLSCYFLGRNNEIRKPSQREAIYKLPDDYFSGMFTDVLRDPLLDGEIFVVQTRPFRSFDDPGSLVARKDYNEAAQYDDEYEWALPARGSDGEPLLDASQVRPGDITVVPLEDFLEEFTVEGVRVGDLPVWPRGTVRDALGQP